MLTAAGAKPEATDLSTRPLWAFVGKPAKQTSGPT
nr:hypothetical protein [Sinorhizobium medicae]